MVSGYVMADRTRARQRVDSKIVDPIKEVLRDVPSEARPFGFLWEIDTPLVAQWEAPWTE